MFAKLMKRYKGADVAHSVSIGFIVWGAYIGYFVELNHFVLALLGYSIFTLYRINYPTSTLSKLTGKAGTLLPILFCVIGGVIYLLSTETKSFGIFDDIFSVLLLSLASRMVLMLFPSKVSYRTSFFLIFVSFFTLPITGMICPIGVIVLFHCLKLDERTEKFGRFNSILDLLGASRSSKSHVDDDLSYPRIDPDGDYVIDPTNPHTLV